MDHFESIICTLLEAEHKWVRKSFKVKLTHDDKIKIKKPSIPRPEIDLLAFDFSKNKVTAWEAKSFLDSPGVKLSDIQEEHEVAKGRYKLFTSTIYREVILSRLLQNLIEHGMANAKTKVFLGLAAGNVYQKQSEEIRKLLERKNCFFWSPDDIRQKVEELANSSYENDPAIITAKILK